VHASCSRRRTRSASRCVCAAQRDPWHNYASRRSWLHSHPGGRSLSLSDFFPALSFFFSIHSPVLKRETRMGAAKWRHRLLAFPAPRPWIRWRWSKLVCAARGPSKLPLIANQTRTPRWPHGQFAPFQVARNTLIYANIVRTRMRKQKVKPKMVIFFPAGTKRRNGRVVVLHNRLDYPHH